MTKGVYMPKRTGGNGEHVVTMREVAKAAGVSIKTVSNVVNDYEFVSQATRDKVNKAIVELGYTVNVSARNLRRGQTGIIGLAIPDLQMPYFAQLSSLGIVYPEETAGSKKVLSAAALTYVAALATAILNLVRILMLRRDE